jgi:hypothetical protein
MNINILQLKRSAATRGNKPFSHAVLGWVAMPGCFSCTGT